MRRAYLYLLVVIIILAVAAGLVLSNAFGGKGTVSLTSLIAYDNKPVPAAFISLLQVPNNIGNAVGIGVANNYVTPISGVNSIQLNGKPEVLYIGAEFCPYCAAERWAMAIALMKFGTFSNLHFMTSAASDTPASIPTFTFYNSTYSSSYISFVSVEQTTNTRAPLQTLNSSEAYLFSKYNPGEGIPFILFANRSYWISANYDPQSVLYGRNWSYIASQLYNTSSVQSEAIIGTANLMTAQICAIDNNTPSSVCSQPYVQSIEASTKLG